MSAIWLVVDEPLQGGGELNITRHITITDATVAKRGVVQLAADGESVAGKAVQANDSRLGGSGPHTHPISEVVNLQTTLDGKAPTTHSHVISDVTALQTALDGKSALIHSHVIADITSLQTSLDGKALASHTHPQSEVTNLVTDLGNKSNVGHTHSLADITGDGALAALNTVGTTQIDNDSVTYAKLQNVSAISKLLGRGSGAGAGDPEEITLGSNLSMSGTTLNASGGGGGGGSAATVEVNLGSVARFAGKFTITDAGIAPSSKVLCWQAPGPYTGKGGRADESELQPVSVIVVEPGSGNAVVKWQTPPIVVLNQMPRAGGQPASTIVPGLKDAQAVSGGFLTRIGRVRGNMKFSYMVL